MNGTRTTLDWGALRVGDALPTLVIDVTATRVVAGAIASRDFMPVHHDRGFANQQGAPDIFMNILSDTGYCSRFLTDWAGPDAMVRNLAIRLGVPVFPGHTLTYTGTVTALRRDGDDGIVEVELRAMNDLGEHVSGTATLSLPVGRGVMTVGGLTGRAAIVGIGQTEFSKESGRTELQLACEAVLAALDDAGLAAADVDGLVTFTMDTNEETEVARNLGIRELSMFSRVGYGGGASAGTVLQAAMAVATGVADVVVCYRAFNERSGNRFGNMSGRISVLPLWLSWYAPYGLMTPACVGRDAGAPVHGAVRSHERRLRADRGRRPRPRRDESRRVVLRAPDHDGRPPGVALDHRAGAPVARLLPGERRRCRGCRDLGRTRP